MHLNLFVLLYYQVCPQVTSALYIQKPLPCFFNCKQALRTKVLVYSFFLTYSVHTNQNQFKSVRNYVPHSFLLVLQEFACAVTWTLSTCITSLQWWTVSGSSPAPSTGRWQQCRATWRTSLLLRRPTWCSPSLRNSRGCGCAMIRSDTFAQMSRNLFTLPQWAYDGLIKIPLHKMSETFFFYFLSIST